MTSSLSIEAVSLLGEMANVNEVGSLLSSVFWSIKIVRLSAVLKVFLLSKTGLAPASFSAQANKLPIEPAPNTCHCTFMIAGVLPWGMEC